MVLWHLHLLVCLCVSCTEGLYCSAWHIEPFPRLHEPLIVLYIRDFLRQDLRMPKASMHMLLCSMNRIATVNAARLGLVKVMHLLRCSLRQSSEAPKGN